MSSPSRLPDPAQVELAAARDAVDSVALAHQAYLDAETAFITKIAAAHNEASISWREVAEAYCQVRDWANACGLSGFSERWKALIPYDLLTLRRYAEALPTSSDGSWHGHTGWDEMRDPSTYPPRGVHVAFALFGNAGQPVAIGATKQFREHTKRLWKHDGLRWSSWTAQHARDREDSFARRAELRARYGQPNAADAASAPPAPGL